MKKLYVTQKCLDNKFKHAFSRKHLRPNCPEAMKSNNHLALVEVKKEDMNTVSNLRTCTYCAKYKNTKNEKTYKELIKPKQLIKKTIIEKETVQFIPPKIADLNTQLSIPINLTETITINGIKYIRYDKVPPVLKTFGVMIMEDGSEFSLVK